jgi:hypothetical protein
VVGGAVDPVVVGAAVVAVVGPPPAAVVDVVEPSVVVEVDDDDEVGDDVDELDGGAPGRWPTASSSRGGSVKSPVSLPSSAAAMNRDQIWAGSPPPVTEPP